MGLIILFSILVRSLKRFKIAVNVKYVLQFTLLFFCLSSLAQNSLVDRLHTMQLHPRLKEKVYIHANKTSYFSDDVIWFKAYVGDSVNHPSIQTRKLITNLVDLDGNVIFSRNTLIKDGVGLGQFELNKAIAPGIYYLQARTNYMRNFGEDYQYLQEIKILGQELTENSQENYKYDVQLFPESGNLIENIENTLGIKATKNGKSIAFTGSILNQHDAVVSKFESEHAGMSSCKLMYKKGEKYNAKIKFQDTTIILALPRALPKGISLQIDNSDENTLKVQLKTNDTTFHNQVYSNYSLLYHQDRQIFKLVSLAKLDSNIGLIETNKNIFLDGVHTVTLLADDQPIAERKFYIETERKKTSVALEKLEPDSDSLTYRISLSGINKALKANLSISVLSEDSKVANQKNTIQSAFLLRPYVNGYIENPAYYFNPKNKKRKEHLDLLLLSQGWTQYTPDEFIQSINPTEKYKFEAGFELKGRLEDEVKHKNLALIPDNFQIIDKIPIKGRSEFIFQNLKVFKEDTVRVAYQNWLGKIIKPSQITFDTIRENNTDRFIIPRRQFDQKSQPDSNDTLNKFSKNILNINTTEINALRKLEGTIDLDEVVVSKKQRNQNYFRRRKIIEKYKPLVQDIGRYAEVPIREVFKNHEQDLISFLNANGTRINEANPLDMYFESASKSEAFLWLNGRLVDPNELIPTTSISMKDIAKVMIIPRGRKFFEGKTYAGTLYQVFTTDEYQNGPFLFDKYVIKNGFDRSKKYYTPLYTFDQTRASNWIEIDWKPQLKTNKQGELTFKIPNDKKNTRFLMSIQGFSHAGHLISETILTD